MPSSPDKLCADCSNRAINGTRWCAAHQVINNRKLNSREYEKHRAHDPIRKLYKTPRWERVRQIVFRRDILCVECGHQKATECDHIVDARVYIAAGGDFFDKSNLRGLCKECHDARRKCEQAALRLSKQA